MKRMILLCGCPGIAKEEMAEQLFKIGLAEQQFNVDHLFRTFDDYIFYPDHLHKVNELCYNKVKEAIESCKGIIEYPYENIVISNLFLRVEDRKQYLKLARLYGYQLIFHRFHGDQNNEKVKVMDDSFEDFTIEESLAMYYFPNEE